MVARAQWKENRWRVIAWSTAVALLLLPLLAMQVSDEVIWDGLDFAIFGSLLLGVGVAMELAVRRSGNTAYLFGVGVALATAFIIIALNGAVGIIGTEQNQANLMFVGGLATGVIGALLARFKPQGMARAMLAAALVHLLVGAIALIGKLGSSGPAWPWDVAGLTAGLTALWLMSAWLFRKAIPK